MPVVAAPAPQPITPAEHRELERLGREHKELKTEREILT